jgi:cobalamin biosynthesis Mg chelatase CobN
VGTAAYLNVFGSILRVLKNLKSVGYDVGDLPGNERQMIESVLQVGEGRRRGCLVWRGLQGARSRDTCASRASHTPPPPPPPPPTQASEAKFNSADLNIAYRMPVAEYQQVRRSERQCV